MKHDVRNGLKLLQVVQYPPMATNRKAIAKDRILST